MDDQQNIGQDDSSPSASFQSPDTATLEDTVNQVARQQEDAPAAPVAASAAPLQPGQKPDFNTFMSQPDAKQQKPTFDEFMKQGESPPGFFSGEHVGDMTNRFLTHTAVGRVVDAFGYNTEENLQGDTGLSKDVIDDMTKMGVFNDWRHGEALMSKTVGELLLQSAAVIYNSVNRGFGIVVGGAGAASSQAGKEIGGVAGVPFSIAGEMLQHPEGLMGMDVPHGAEESGVMRGAPRPQASIPHEIAQAGDVGAIGARESIYFGLEEPTPEEAARIDHARTVNNFYEEQERLREPKDVHELARDIEPDTFREYDTLDAQKEMLRNQIGVLNEERESQLNAARGAVHSQYADEIADLQGKSEESAARGNKSVYQDLLDKKIAKRDEAISKITSQGDTPQMAGLRDQMMKADERMRDLSTTVSSAYREAQKRIDERGEPMKIEPKDEDLPSEMRPAEVKEEENNPAAPNNRVEEDFARHVVAAGRPVDEANAVAQVVGAHYRTMSELFNGKLGSPMEVYARNIPKLKGVISRAGANVKELSSGANGGIQLATEGARATIKLFQTSNASTLIHELGHHFFDELVRFADHEDAPAQMKQDVETLRAYVGNKKGAFSGFTRGAHEKIARGFERYLMEGTAPSKALGRVFAKFKTWLTDIYQTVQKLRSPITEDVRNVFDRMLATNPEKTVVAEERAGEHLATIHEHDAEETPPEHAGVVRDSIRQESDYLAKLYDPEVYNAINEPDETAGQPAAPVENPPVAATAGSDAGEGSPAAQPVAVSSGGDNAGAKSGGAREDTDATRTKPGSGSRDAEGNGKQPVTSSNSKFRGQDTDLVDKAGNIRLDNLNTPGDVNEVLRATAKDNGDFLGARRGVISTGQQLELADALGMNPWELNFRKIGEAFNAEQVIAARKLMIQSATNVRDLMMKGKKATEEEVKAYAEAVQRHLMIQEHVAGITAEAGRALGAFRKLEGAEEAQDIGAMLKDTTGKTLYQLQQEMEFGKNLKNPAQVAKFLDSTKRASFKDMMLEYYINCLISGPITHFRYSVGNAINALATPLLEIPAAATVGAVRSVLTGSAEERVYYGEALAQLHGLMKGSRDGLYAAADAFKTGVSPALPGEHVSQAFADMNKLGPAIPGKVGSVINLPSKSVSAIHSFFKSLRYEQNLQGLAYRMATNEGLSGGKFTNRVADLSRNPTEEMMQNATSGAMRELFMSPTEYNSTMGALNRAVNSSLPAKIIVPFMKIGSQITRNAFVDRTPLGLLSKEGRETAGYQRGGAAGDMALGKMAVGTALVGTMVGMTLEGMATGDGPEDPAQRAIWLLNHKPNTLTIGGISIPYQGLGPHGMLMRFAANMTETASAWSHEDGLTLAKHFMEGITKSVLDENFMRGVKDMLDAVYHPEEYGVPYVRSFITNWLPFSVGMSQVARKVDPDMRDINTNNPAIQQIIDTARSKTPGLSSELAPKRDRFGEVIPNGGILPQYQNDSVVKKMEDLQIGIGKLNREILGVKLSDGQYDDYSRLAGRLTKQRLNQLVGNPGFNNLADGTQIMVIKKAVEQSREDARNLLIADPQHPENKNILQQAIDKKRAALRQGNH